MQDPAGPVPPPPPPASLRDRLAEAARTKPKVALRRRLGWALVAVVVAILLAQLLGLTSSPIEEKLRRGKPPADTPATPPPAPGTPAR